MESTELYSVSLHDALPISHGPDALAARPRGPSRRAAAGREPRRRAADRRGSRDRKSTRLNSSHLGISYAVCCLKKKKIAPYITSLILNKKASAEEITATRG